MKGKHFEEFWTGDEFVSHRRTITETDIVLFTSITGLLNPIFTDEEFAKEKGLGTRVAPGPLIVSIAMGLSDELLYGTVAAALGVNNVRFTAPVKPGDTLYTKTMVVDKRESASRVDRGVVTLRHEVYNQRQEMVCSFERALMVYKKGVNSGRETL